jgi:hypothetical protein
MESQGSAPGDADRTPLQVVDSSALCPGIISHGEASTAPERKAYTAGPLRTPALPPALPSYLEACADLVAQAVMRGEFDRARELIEQAERASACTGGTAA